MYERDKIMYLNIIAIFLVTQISSTFSIDPWNEGPFTPKHKLYFPTFNAGLDHQLDVWAPEAAGKFPIIYNFGGLGAILPGDVYDTTMKQVASHGIIIVQGWALFTNPATNYQAEWVLDIKAWVETNLQDRLHSDGLDPGLELDHDNIVLMGHSSGAHVVVEFLKHHCDLARGQILFSPVDGVDPFGLIHNFAITPGQLLNYNLPSLLIMTGLDSVPGTIAGGFTPACAPEEMSNLRFYDALPGTTWLVNATKYGHGDVLDEFYYNAMEFIHFCSTDSSQDRDVYRRFIAGSVVSYLSVVIKGQCEYLTFLEDPSQIPVEVRTQGKTDGWTCGASAQCQWSAAPLPTI